MCYKISHTGDGDIYEKRFSAKFNPAHQSNRKEYHHANGFAFPGLPVITQESPDEIQIAEWALVPHFAFNDADAKKYRVGNLNAKCETIFELKSFKKPIMERRCLVLANGFYESMDVNGAKYPYFIYRKDQEPFAFAGIYSYWKKQDESVVKTFSIVTTTPNSLMRQVHNLKLRMPVILPADLERRWLRPDLIADEIKDLMLPLEDGILTAHPVHKDLNKAQVNTNNAQITEVYEYPELAGLLVA